MTTQPISDQPPVYHAGLCACGAERVDEADLDYLCGYVVEEVTPDNAVGLGYDPDDGGLKLRRNQVHLTDVADLAEAKRLIMADLSDRLCLLSEPRGTRAFYEAALRAPRSTV